MILMEIKVRYQYRFEGCLVRTLAVMVRMVNAVVYQALTWKLLASYGLAGGRLVKEQVSCF